MDVRSVFRGVILAASYVHGITTKIKIEIRIKIRLTYGTNMTTWLC